MLPRRRLQRILLLGTFYIGSIRRERLGFRWYQTVGHQQKYRLASLMREPYTREDFSPRDRP